VLFLLAGDLVPTSATAAWLEPMVEQALRGSIGVVGGRVLDAVKRAEHEGLRVGGPSGVESVGLRLPVIQRASAVSADCMAVRRAAFASVGGFDTRYRVCMYDLDLCLRLRRAGLATLYSPLTELQHLRRRFGMQPATDDLELFRAVWEGTPESTDPFVSPWLESVSPLAIRDDYPG
jgi:O-antigen biosynthesis protein